MNVTPKFDFTDKEMKAARGVARGLSYHAACKEAGYSDPGGEADRLKKDLKWLQAIVFLSKGATTGWTDLLEKSRLVLDKSLSEYLSMSIEDQERVRELAAARRDAIQAAKTVCDTVRQSGAVPMATAAEAEDKGLALDELVQRYLGQVAQRAALASVDTGDETH